MLDKNYLPDVEVNFVDSFIIYGLKNESLVFFDTFTNISNNPTVVYNPDTFQKFILDWKYVSLIQTDTKFIDLIYYNSNRVVFILKQLMKEELIYQRLQLLDIGNSNFKKIEIDWRN